MAKPRNGLALVSSRRAFDVAELGSVFNALPTAILVVAIDNSIRYMNPAAETLLGTSYMALENHLLPYDALALISRKAMENNASVKKYDVELSGIRIGTLCLDIQAAPLVADGRTEAHGAVISLQPQGMMSRLNNRMTQREVMRSTGIMAAMLAHEVKNPLSGIKGAAQLLQQDLDDDQQKLAGLICSEVDRIKTLVNQIEFLSNPAELERTSINIHEVLQYVNTLAAQGVAKDIRIVELYDPSLPDVGGNRDLLVQLFLNLVKNAAEATHDIQDGRITLTTRYDNSYRYKNEDGSVVSLPICVTVQDTGKGIPSHLRASIFDPFVSSKPGGKGLGLSIVSKIVADHGGAIELGEDPASTVFKVWLPVYKG